MIEPRGWTHFQRRYPSRLASLSYIERQGNGHIVSNEQQIVRVRRIGFGCTDDWGEGNWTAKDLR